MKEVLGKKTCFRPFSNSYENTINSTFEQSTVSNTTALTPKVDIFLNPDKWEDVAEISAKKRGIAKTYFGMSDMKKLYPKLFQILWESSLPCLPGLIVLCCI